MKLTDIDLNDKTEVAAAHALLAAILGHAVSDDIPGAPSVTESLAQMTVTERVGEVSRTVTVSPATVTLGNHPTPMPVAPPPGDQQRDPAAVFGAQSAAPLPGIPALSTAAAGPLPTAPAALQGSLPGLPGTPAPAPFIAPEVHAQTQATAAALSSHAGGVELDSRGLPWDERIHASTKSKTKPGAWTSKRGVDEATVAQVEAELRARAASSATVPGVPSLTQAAQNVAATPLPGMTAPGLTTTVAQTTDPTTFEQLMPRVTQATVSGILPPTALQQVCGALGLPNVVALQTNPAYVPHAWAQLKASYPALQ